MNEEQFEQLKQQAIEYARRNYMSVAVIYTEDGEWWDMGAHGESKYIKTHEPFTAAIEIHICRYERDGAEWTTYLAPDKPVDYVAETGATGADAERIQAVMDLLEQYKDADTDKA